MSQSSSSAPTLSPSELVSRRNDVICCNVGEEAVLLDLASGIYFGLDPVGSRVWSLIETPRTITEIRDELLKEYEVDEATCETEVLRFLNQTAERGLIEFAAKR